MGTAGLLGVFIEDREPYGFADLPGLSQAWLQDAGGFAFAGLILYVLYALLMPSDQAKSAQDRAGVPRSMLVMLVVALVLYVAAALCIFAGVGPDRVNAKNYVSDPGMYVKAVAPRFSPDLQPVLLGTAGLASLVGIGLPFVRGMLKVRGRRLWALTLLGFREAWRTRLVFVFLIILVPFLVPAKWFVNIKPEDELRSTLAITSLLTNVLILFSAALLASYSIPNDIKNQNLYTVVTKPVERFEVVFGRFVGFVALMTVALAGVTLISWVFIRANSVDEKSRAETMKARVPVRGTLTFQSRKVDFAGTNVGREFDYRKYIAGDPNSPQRAIWNFRSLPGTSAGQDAIPCEFTFDIFRMTKGEENRGVDVTLRVVTWQSPQQAPVQPGDSVWKWANADQQAKYDDAARGAVRRLRSLAADADVSRDEVLRVVRTARPGTPEWAEVNKLAEEFGFYEIAGKEVFDYRPAAVALPTGLIKYGAQGTPPAGPDGRSGPRLQVYVHCQTGGQMLGVADADLSLLEGERSFDQNYFKAAIGLWCRVTILIGIAVVLSSYLAFVVAFLGAMALFLSGYAIDHIVDVSSGRSYAGGPLKAMTNLVKAETPTAQPDESSAVTQATSWLDQLVAWMIRRVVNMIPDIQGMSWTQYVAEGIDIPVEALVMNVIVTAAYLLPWFILGYYLMRSREVAA